MIDATFASKRDTPLSMMEESALEGLTEAQKDQLGKILETYLDDLESGRTVDCEALLEKHPDLAEVIGCYLESIDDLYRAGLKAASSAGGSASQGTALHAESLAATELGDYQIKQEIGRGGMGIVYAARQISLGRDVALKVLPFAAVLDQKQVTRFKNEAQAAAGLHHPNIVPVYAVGCERGVHYFSMQMIEGQSLDQAIIQLRGSGKSPEGEAPCNATTQVGFSTQKSIRSREFSRSVARLGHQAASAIHHAHEHGIVHRDIKPSNLLVDASGKLWVTDFGLARASTESNLTASGDLLGTVRYMSPEQAGGRLQEVDHRSDIYSIGITLYELLTLKPAFDDDTRLGLLHAVEHENPLAPRRLNPAIPVDLETIVLKAIEKDRDDRYLSAEQLADDLDRFLGDRPTIAKRPGVQDRIFRWASRHRRSVVNASLAASVLFVVVTFAALMLAAEQRRTAIEADRAAFHLRETQRVVDNFGALVDQRLEHLPSTAPLRAELLGELKKYYSGFIVQAGDDAGLAADVATAQFRLAAVRHRMGNNRLAIEGYQEALAGFQALYRQAPENLKLLADIALCHNNLGQMHAYQGDRGSAKGSYESSIAIYQSLADRGHKKADANLGRAQMNLGLMLSSSGDPSAAGLLSDAHQSLLRLHDQTPDDAQVLGQLALCENNLASVLLQTDLSGAESLLRHAIARYDRLVESQPNSPQYHADQALALGNLAAILSHAGKHGEARELLRDVVKVRLALVKLEPTTVSHARDLAIAYNQLGQLFVGSNDEDRARQAYSQSADWFGKTIERSPDDHRSHSRLGVVLANLGVVERKVGDVEAAADWFERAIGQQQHACDLSPQSKAYSRLLQHHRDQLAGTSPHDELPDDGPILTSAATSLGTPNSGGAAE